MSVSPARRIAFDVLRRVEAEGAFASDLLHARLGQAESRASGLKPEDAALATELTLGVLRWQRLLDFLLGKQTGKPVDRLDLEVRVALRLGLYQLRFLTRIPARAAVNESVELVKRARKRSAASLVNAVLRRGGALEPESLLPTELAAAERLGILFSHPTWMVERWLARYGESRTVALLETNNRPPRSCCAIHGETPFEQIRKALAPHRIKAEPGRWLCRALVVQAGHLAQTEPYRLGWLSIQDEASQMVPLLLDAQPGQSLLDLCAAPGGKTFVLARAAGGSVVVAADRHLHRLREMDVQLERLRIANVARVALDATGALPFGRRFDRILLDAPCSGTGTLARNPEIRWRLRPEDLADLHARQVALLRNALEQLAPGGRIVYATCSLEAEENEQVIEEVLRGVEGVHPVDSRDALAKHLVAEAHCAELFDARGWFRTFPPEHGTDGFVAVVLQRM